MNGSFSLDNIIFLKISIYIQFLLSIINFLILFANIKNFYYVGKILFYIPQFVCVFILLIMDDYWKENIITIYFPFFVVQTFFFFKLKKMFSD